MLKEEEVTQKDMISVEQHKNSLEKNQPLELTYKWVGFYKAKKQ